MAVGIDYCEDELCEVEGTLVSAGQQMFGEGGTYGVVLQDTGVLELVVVLQGSSIVVSIRLDPP